MRRLIALVGLLAFFTPSVALAAACSSVSLTNSPCDTAGLYCAVDARLPDGAQCLARCSATETCTGTDTCVTISGSQFCVANTSALATGSGTTLPSCATGRTCPTDHTYSCVSSQCFLANGQPCLNDNQCLSGSACTPAATGSGHVCSPSSTPVGSGSDAAPERPFVPITPTLGAPIPGVSLSPATKEGDYVYVPYLAQYVNGVYRYLIGVSLIAAIVMTVYGGFRYLVGSSLGDIKAGKTIITNALGGMLLVLAAYLILNSINPATLNLSTLQLVFVDRIDIESSLLTTQVDTVGVTDEEEGISAPATGSATSAYTDCPVTLSTPADDPARSHEARTTEFKTDIASFVTGGSSRDRVVRMAEAAARCGVRFNSCGATAEEIYTTAGSSARGFQTHSVPSSVVNYMDAHKCATYSRECNRPAMSAAFDLVRGQISGWPEVWTNELQPGDVITVFNANSSVAGLHRAIFMGWASTGRAQVVQGAWTRFVSEGTICLTSACSNPEPLVRTFQPRP